MQNRGHNEQSTAKHWIKILLLKSSSKKKEIRVDGKTRKQELIKIILRYIQVVHSPFAMGHCPIHLSTCFTFYKFKPKACTVTLQSLTLWLP